MYPVITPPQSYKNYVISNVAFPDGLQTNSIGTGRSIVTGVNGLTFGVTIKNWTVGEKKVWMQNFQSDRPGGVGHRCELLGAMEGRLGTLWRARL